MKVTTIICDADHLVPHVKLEVVAGKYWLTFDGTIIIRNVSIETLSQLKTELAKCKNVSIKPI